MVSIPAAAASLQGLAAAPFKRQLPLGKLSLLFVLVLVLAFQWRLILDRIEEG